MIRINDITSRILTYHPKANVELVEKAYVYSAKVHQGQIRLSGEPYLSHPLEVAHILAQMKMDVVCIAAGLLHDVLEDTPATLQEITRLFGQETAAIVDGVTKISRIPYATREQRQASNVRKMLLAMSSDIRVILVKLVDRLHNMRTLGFHPPAKQRIIAQETLDIYAPLAGRMGIYWMKSSLEDLSLFYLEPQIYEKINQEMTQRRDEREKFIREVKELLARKMEEVGIRATVLGRHKHYYSIYRKMLMQKLDVSQVYDILAFRVIVDTVKECYEALGHIHAMWKPVPGRFKDYISVPKANKYQSLHTTVIGPFGQRMEIQIRTWEMNKVAEEGIAAHWKYKEGNVITATDEQQFAWLRQLLEWQQNLQDPHEFLETVRMDLFPDEVYLFTPKGDVKRLPRGATPVDFAYSIHSEIGHHCIGAKVNNRMVPLRTELKTGNIVEIITSPKQRPSKDWLDFVKTPRAKNKIRQWIKHQERDESITLGRSILERALEKERISLPNLAKSEQLEAVSRELSFQSSDDLLAEIGFGNVSASQVVHRLKPRLGMAEERPAGLVTKVVERLKRRSQEPRLKVTGIGGMLMRFAHCCRPLPGEEVVGVITRGRGITVHQKRCRHIHNAELERLVELTWDSSSEETHQAQIRVTSLDKKGMLADISAVITQKDANIIQAQIKTTLDQKGIALFTVELGSYQQLTEIMTAIKRIPNVLLVERL